MNEITYNYAEIKLKIVEQMVHIWDTKQLESLYNQTRDLTEVVYIQKDDNFVIREKI